MTDHAGPRRYECNPGTKLWRPPVEVTHFWRPKSSFGALFWKDQKRLYWSRGGGIVWNKSCWKWFKLLFGFILIIYICLVLQKLKRAPKPLLGRQNCASVIYAYNCLGIIVLLLFFISFHPRNCIFAIEKIKVKYS